MIYANLLCKRNVNIDRMRDDCKDIFLCMRDIDSGYMRDESKIFLRDSHINDKLSDEVGDDFSGYYNDMIDISCI